VTTGVWQGSSISTTYTDAKVTSVSAGTGISVNATTGAVTVTNSGVTSITGTANQITASASTGGVTLSLPQNIHTSAVPTFKAVTLTSDTDSRVLNLRELTSTSGNIIQFQSSAGSNLWEIISGGGIPNFHTALTIGGNTALHAGNYNSYSPTLTGTGASGNWGISISGNAATATSADQIDGVGFRNTGSNSAVAANTLDSNGMTYVTDVDGSSTNLTGNSTDGALYSQIYSSSWQHQIYGDYRTGIMYVRGKNNGTWAGWKRVALSSATTFSSVTSLTFTHNLGTANLTAQVFDTNGDMFFPSNIRISSTQVIVTFASSRSGRLVVTG
jgi:hypothetical protein